MKEKYIVDDFISYNEKDDKYYDDCYVYEFNLDKLFYDYKTLEETPQEIEARLLREKAKLREDKIDKLLGL